MRLHLRVVRAFAVAMVVLMPALASAGSMSTADAGKMLGTWALTFTSDMGPIAMTLNLKDQAGTVAGEITMDAAGPTPSVVTDISKTGSDVVLKYTLDFQGMSFPVKLTLTPDGDGLKAMFDAADGMFTAPGTGKKQ